MYCFYLAQRAKEANIYAVQPSKGKINVQYRMPTNTFLGAVDPMLDTTTGSLSGTATRKAVSYQCTFYPYTPTIIG